jgi:hypothetical protein
MINHLENHKHAFIKNDIVISILTFDDHNPELLEDCRKHFQADEVVCCCDNGIAYLDGSWDGKQFIPPSPFPSWVWSTDKWEAPVPKPDNENCFWNELTQEWNMIVFPSE